jgi:hypothetical protein
MNEAEIKEAATELRSILEDLLKILGVEESTCAPREKNRRRLQNADMCSV